MEYFKGKNVLGRVMFPRTIISGKRSSPNIMTFYLPDIQEKLRPLMLSRNIIGGQECGLSSRTMSKDMGYVNNSWSTRILHNLVPGPTTTRPFANISMDLIADLPLVTLDNGTVVDVILSIVDHRLMKGVILTPCSRTLTEEGTGKILLYHVYKQFGLSNSIISDQDPWFTTKSFQELLKILGIKSKLTISYRPQSNGTTEHFNQEIKASLGFTVPQTLRLGINPLALWNSPTTINNILIDNIVWTYNGIITPSYPEHFQIYQISFHGRTDPTTHEGPKGSNSCPWVSLMTYGRMTQEQIPWIQTWTIGLAQHLKSNTIRRWPLNEKDSSRILKSSH